MQTFCVKDFGEWREAARTLLRDQQMPDAIDWQDGCLPVKTSNLFTSNSSPHPKNSTPSTVALNSRVPSSFIPWAEKIACHRNPQRWELLYSCLWRLTHGERHLLQDAGDLLNRRLQLMLRSVSRDIHKTHAFVRFRKVLVEGQDTYLAFHRPDHYILRPASTFFLKRFRVQRWGILTPDASVCWDGQTLLFGAGMPASAAPQSDELEHLWLTYYRNIFNPARIKIKAMKKEMPVRHWATLPETAIIADMLREAPARVEEMLRRQGAKPSTGALRRRERLGLSRLQLDNKED